MTFLMVTLFSVFGFSGNELPQRYNQQDMNLQSIPFSKRLTLKADFKIPKGFKGTQMAQLDVYEKHEGGWRKLQTLRENKSALLRTQNTSSFQEVLNLSSDKSDVALDLSISFCNKICVINNFQGVAKRSAKTKNNSLVVKMNGFLPHEKIKKRYQLKKKPAS